MNYILSGFCLALVSARVWPAMPSSLLSPLIIAGTLLLCALWQVPKHHYPIKALLCGALAGVLWMMVFCHVVLSLREVDEYSSLRGQTTPLTVRGKIISLVAPHGDWINLEVAESRTSSRWQPPRRWRLGWDVSAMAADNAEVGTLPQIGEVWLFEVRPRAFVSVLNQGGFNQQQYLLAQHVTAKGTVINAKRLAAAQDVRSRLLAQLMPLLQTLPNGDMLLALTMGERGLIGERRWQQLRQTGTGHLVAISGLHLSVVALWLYALARGLSRCWPGQGRWGLLTAQLLALLGAGVYAWLAGFAIPVQRALLMLLALVLVSWSMRNVSAWERWLWAMALVLLMDPLAPLSGGFWLSFLALALILLEWQRPLPAEELSWRAATLRWCRQFWRVQWRLCLGLTLVQAMLFGGMTLHSFWINLLLVPWFSVVVIPLSLLALTLWRVLEAVPQVASMPMSWPWELADWALLPANWLWQLSDTLPGNWVLLPSMLTLSLGFGLLAGVIWLWRPRPWHVVIPLFLLLPALLQVVQWRAELPLKGWQLHVLDVGQGLAVVAQQGTRALLFDTGAAFPSGFSYAERVILPFLASAGVRHLDYLLISHGDNDHAGGFRVLHEAFPGTLLITDTPWLPASADCRPRQWRWQQLTLTLLGPAQPQAGNNGSCVLLLDDGVHRVLLPGDIELAGEVALLRQGVPLHAQILLAPHHGSKTSSSADFIGAVNPEWVVFPAGFANRWHFPKEEVRQRYQAVHARQLVSGEQGQISFMLDDRGIRVRTYRQQLAPYWYNRLFGFGYTRNPE
ncbi:DNA internalization-related competence protein ComEC/Rec2 [Shewanella sp. YIC-542]|uniref:DNA internalization-related competence protein ComEC/Rec2 n=1 Tax=Shewanella mytili TaxID=3377111 RepID=UPI00398E4662